MILIFTWKDYSGNTYGEYDYPSWANYVGWVITFSSVICIPIVAVFKVFQEEGPIFAVSLEILYLFNEQQFFKRIKKLVKPSPEWGPASPSHKQFEGANNYDAKFKGLKRDVEGSNMTLITNASQSAMVSAGNKYRYFSFAHFEH